MIADRGTSISDSFGNALNLVFTFIPKFIGFLVILLVGWIVAIMGFVVLIALEQLQIAQALLNELFGAIVAAAALAFGLAFGLGGRETAQRLLNRSEKSLNIAASQVSLQQIGMHRHKRIRQPSGGHCLSYHSLMKRV